MYYLCEIAGTFTLDIKRHHRIMKTKAEQKPSLHRFIMKRNTDTFERFRKIITGLLCASFEFIKHVLSVGFKVFCIYPETVFAFFSGRRKFCYQTVNLSSLF